MAKFVVVIELEVESELTRREIGERLINYVTDTTLVDVKASSITVEEKGYKPVDLFNLG